MSKIIIDPELPGQDAQQTYLFDSPKDRLDFYRKEIHYETAILSNRTNAYLSAQLASETFDVEHVVAKINDPVRAEAYTMLGLATNAQLMQLIRSHTTSKTAPKRVSWCRQRAMLPSAESPIQ